MTTALFAGLGLGCLVVSGCGSSPATNVTTLSSPALGRPNILFILTDDQGIGDFSLHGNDSIRTPNMDSLLRGGARFTRFYVDPVCAPTRASFLSGLYAPRTGAIYVTRRRETMAAEITTLAEHLQTAGYRTGLFGKWHNGATHPYDPAGQGFDRFLGFTSGHFNDYFSGELLDEAGAAVPFREDLTDLLTDAAIDFSTASADPFFTMLAYQAPHTPLQVADDHWDAVAPRDLTPFHTGVYAMVESVDEQMGRLLDRLEAVGQLDNTIVIFASDNGPNSDRYRMGLRGRKGSVDEGGTRVPFVIRLPAGHPANGRTFDTPAAHIDLLPTLLDYLSLSIPAGLDGVSLLPLLEGGTLPHRYIYTFQQGLDFDPDRGSMRDSSYLYVRHGRDAHELYHLPTDPGQDTNLYASLPRVAERMTAEYDRMAAGVFREDRVGPPIEIARRRVRLLAHEGEPRPGNAFSQPNGWANDWVEDMRGPGIAWPVRVDSGGVYRIAIDYHLSSASLRYLDVLAGEAKIARLLLPPYESSRQPVADRVARTEVYPRTWGRVEAEDVRISSGTRELILSGPNSTGLWIKQLEISPER